MLTEGIFNYFNTNIYNLKETYKLTILDKNLLQPPEDKVDTELNLLMEVAKEDSEEVPHPVEINTQSLSVIFHSKLMKI